MPDKRAQPDGTPDPPDNAITRPAAIPETEWLGLTIEERLFLVLVEGLKAICTERGIGFKVMVPEDMPEKPSSSAPEGVRDVIE